MLWTFALKVDVVVWSDETKSGVSSTSVIDGSRPDASDPMRHIHICCGMLGARKHKTSPWSFMDGRVADDHLVIPCFYPQG
jgi:hypothetical protein